MSSDAAIRMSMGDSHAANIGWPSVPQPLALWPGAVAARWYTLIVCYALALYRPHGGHDELWLELTASGRGVRRVRSFYGGVREKEPVEVTLAWTDQEATDIRATLAALGVWSLPPYQRVTFDGWVCTVAVASGSRLRVTEMHNPAGPHLELLRYLLELAPLPEEGSGGAHL